jgi:outer membrane protein insertion porin family
VSLLEPDIFREHMDTIGLRVDAYKTIRVLDSYDTDKIGASLTLSRIFDETTTVSLNIRDEAIEIKNIDANAPLLVWENEGTTEIRAMRLSMTLSDLDNPLHPRTGYNLETFAEYGGGAIGGAEDFYRLGVLGELYRPFYSDSFDRKHVAYAKVALRWAETFGGTKDLYPSERFFMGGSNLRGFDQRRAGPVQFGEPMGGKALLLSTLEYQFPLVSTQMEGTTFHTEIIRGVLFSDFGLLGLDINDSSFSEPRLTVGFGVRIQVPVLQVPIQLDLAWPILSQETDREEQLFFSFRHF